MSNQTVQSLSERMRTRILEIERLEQAYDGRAYDFLVRPLLEQVRDLGAERHSTLELEDVW